MTPETKWPEGVTEDDVMKASAAADIFEHDIRQVTGSHLNRLALLFADHRKKTEDAIGERIIDAIRRNLSP